MLILFVMLSVNICYLWEFITFLAQKFLPTCLLWIQTHHWFTFLYDDDDGRKGKLLRWSFIRNHRRLSLGPDLPVSSSLATPTICEGAANRHHRPIIVIIIVINHHQHNVNIIIMIIIRFTMFLIEGPPFEYTVLLTIIGESLSLVSFIRDHQYHNKKKLSLQVTVRSKLNNITWTAKYLHSALSQ